ncbi:ABC transporter permease [Acetobacteraceae bacterium H6797]|nr:ABC transporter permease [Acetobacteraceae bacterium H6797]
MEEAEVDLREEGGARRLLFTGALNAEASGRLWHRAMSLAHRDGGIAAVDLSRLTLLDTSGAALVLSAAGAAPVEGAAPPVEAVLARTRKALEAPRPAPPPKPLPFVQGLGAWGVSIARERLASAAFIGEAAVTSAGQILRPYRIRLNDALRHLDEAGTRAFPLTMLLGVLIGIILAFQSSWAMRQYGAEIFIPRLVGISLLRELGPLLAAVILAGRTGSAYAAEIGTMTVNEEVDALRIMGIDPMAMLVFPRLLAATLVMPVLALLMDLAGLVGMGLVMAGLGFTINTTISQLSAAIGLNDLLGGLFKAAVFGLAIAGIGCRAGLNAGRGPRAVGDAATAAVVGGIVSIVLLDGLFAVLFFRLGI